MDRKNIPEKLTFSRREVIHLTKLDGRVLDYWEREFGVIHPSINKSGSKFYTKQDIEIILEIKRYLTVEKIDKARLKSMLKKEHQGAAPATQTISGLKKEKIEKLRKGLKEILTIIEENDKK